jgi:5-(carboxyamino)imidazole ribonucleotide synthase
MSVAESRITNHEPRTIGILGAGQLGKMLAEAATKLGFETHVFAPDADPIAASVATRFTHAEYTDIEALQAFAHNVDVITLEFENVPVAPLRMMTPPLTPPSRGGELKVCPSPSVLEVTQHRVKEKTLAQSLGIGTAPFMAVHSRADLEKAMAAIGTPAILKTCTLGYDGKGQWKIANRESRIGNEIFHESRITNHDYIYEGFVNFTQEISVIVARSTTGEVQCFEPVENVHKNHILHTTTVPANISQDVTDKAIAIATKLAVGLDVVGLLAVELFVTETGNVLMNEMAPRPHNSGHWSLDGCNVSQFEQAIRAVTGMPLIAPKRTAPKVVMTNLIGNDINSLDQWGAAHIHIYGKKEVREGRKMGHVTDVSREL